MPGSTCVVEAPDGRRQHGATPHAPELAVARRRGRRGASRRGLRFLQPTAERSEPRFTSQLQKGQVISGGGLKASHGRRRSRCFRHPRSRAPAERPWGFLPGEGFGDDAPQQRRHPPILLRRQQPQGMLGGLVQGERNGGLVRSTSGHGGRSAGMGWGEAVAEVVNRAAAGPGAVRGEGAECHWEAG